MRVLHLLHLRLFRKTVRKRRPGWYAMSQHHGSVVPRCDLRIIQTVSYHFTLHAQPSADRSSLRRRRNAGGGGVFEEHVTASEREIESAHTV